MRYIALVLGSLAAQLALGGISQAADPRAAELTYEPWTKTCLTQASCFVSAGARGQCSPSGGFITLALQSSGRTLLNATLGTRTMLQGPISLQIDQDIPINIPSSHCYATGCGGTYEAGGELIERLKHAQTIVMEATSLTGQKMSISLSTAGFTKAYDGPGTEPKVYEETRPSEQMKMQERAKQSEEQRKAFECTE